MRASTAIGARLRARVTLARARVLTRAPVRMSAAASSASTVTKDFFLDDFASRQWDDDGYSGTRIACDKGAFVRAVQEIVDARGSEALVEGYAPFCKHVFVPNFVDAKVGNVEITRENEKLLRSGYGARSSAELAVLTRWFSALDVEAPRATHLDVILYSREQLELERAAVPSKGERPPLPNAPWGIISVKAQNEDYETPMQPITMMRNALGREHGGSGVPLEKDKYDASVAYWSRHAPIVASEDGANGD